MSLPWQFLLPLSLGQIVSQLSGVILILAIAKLTVVYIDIFCHHVQTDQRPIKVLRDTKLSPFLLKSSMLSIKQIGCWYSSEFAALSIS